MQFPFLFHLIRSYGYFIIFPIVVIEGPGITFLAGFLVSLGYLNPYWTYFTVLFADLVSDVAYYAAGRWWFNSASGKILTFFKMGPKTFSRFETVFKKHKGKIMFFGKLSSFIGGVVMYIAGLVKVPFVEFIVINVFGALGKTLLLLLAGYYIGGLVLRMGTIFDLASSIGLIALSIVLFLIYFGITSFSDKYIRKAER